MGTGSSAVEETGLGDDAEVIRDLAAKGAPLRRKLEPARTERLALARLNPGSLEYADTAASITARYRRIYSETPAQIRGG